MVKRVTVKTKNGKVRGIQCVSTYNNKSYYSFSGIPYAEPPVGELRFQNPVAKKSWYGTYDASYERDDCTQFSFIKLQVCGSDNCLYLNVHVPENPSTIQDKKAVVVLVHSGNGFWGSGSKFQHGSPDYLMQHDIVYVTINYRLHVLGFLNLKTPDCPGNVGLKDIVMSLKWIKDNIDNFGGDPNNVTLIGSSTGSLFIHCLMVSHAAKGLFHKAILMGMYVYVPYVYFEEDNTVELGFKLGRKLGFQGDNVQDLLKFLRIQHDQILLKGFKELSDELELEWKRINPSSLFFPSIEQPSENAFFDKSPVELMNSTSTVPLIFGICENENIFIHKPPLPEFVDKNFKTIYRHQPWCWLKHLDDKTLDIIEKEVKDRYYQNIKKNEEVYAIIEAHTDLVALEFYETVADVIHKNSPQSPVYVYKFEYLGEINPLTNTMKTLIPNFKIKGTSHADDSYYWMCREANPNKRDAAVIETITKLFTNFAKTGNPNNTEMLEYWKPSTPEEPSHLRIHRRLRVINSTLNEKGCKFWEDIKKRFWTT